MNNSIVDVKIDAILNTPGGFEKLAAEVLPKYIKTTRDYNGFCRKILQVHNVDSADVHLLNGEPFVYYAKDLNAAAAFYGRDFETPRYQVEGSGVNVPIGTIASDEHTITRLRVLTEKFDYLNRTKELAAQAMVKAEDFRLINLVEASLLGNSVNKKAPDHANQIVTTTDTTLSKAHLVGLRKKLTAVDLPIDSFLMRADRLEDINTWNYNELDQLTQREVLETGVKNSLWGIKIITSRIINPNIVYIFSTPEFVGRMPVLQDLSVELTQRSNTLEKGLFMYEFLGMCLVNSKSVGKLILEFSEGTTNLADPDVAKLDESVEANEFLKNGRVFGSLEDK